VVSLFLLSLSISLCVFIFFQRFSFSFLFPDQVLPADTIRSLSPGRFYAVAGMKQIFGLLLSKYDCELSDLKATRSTSWRNCNIPSADAPIVLRPRAVAE